ncbi:putative Late nodulin [Medicago truncatula]|uniref:Nodule Cysteine-Rich (NCR) secreted peptide n=1 Tax=Medicago truncatula TaxID=3880 RepID=G7I4L5_MEDTR|nr:Nodule Cysteine-Rich (NCR) secreted peptide [Medicago truncatula]RHN78551.1 putative Late nodulin [Medicago truncatula]
MTHIFKFVYALIIFLSIYVAVNDCIRIHCKDDFDCIENRLQVGCRLQREKPRCVNLVCRCLRR